MKNIKVIFTLILLFAFQINNAQEICNDGNADKTPKTNTIIVARYSYYPNLEAYYDIANNFYVFKENGEWTTAQEIPSGYRGYSLFNKINVKIYDYDGETPQEMLAIHKIKHPYVSNKNKREVLASDE